MELGLYLHQAFAQHALLAASVVGIMCGLIGPFVINRGLAFAVHGTSELAFTGAAAALLLGLSPALGALTGSLVVAAVIGRLGAQEHDRNSSIGVVLAFGLGLGVLLLGFYRGFATQATNILFGNIFGVSGIQLAILVGIGVIVGLTMLVIYRPLLFASVDPEVAIARGVKVEVIGIIFLIILALTVTAAAQVVGTLLVLSLAITPAAAANQLANRPGVVTGLSVVFALTAADGGVLASLASGTIKPSVFVTFISFAIYLVARGIAWYQRRP